MKPLSYSAANLFGGVVIVPFLIDPHRPLTPIFVLLGLVFVCAVLPSFWRRG
jgi:hypothetical protein